MMCSSCGLEKKELISTRSEINPKMTLTLCQSCRDKRFEPRYLVIIAGRMNGFESIKKYISDRRYFGPEILASDLA